MALSSAQIAKILVEQVGQGGAAGLAAALRRNNRSTSGSVDLSPAQVQFVADLASLPAPAATSGYAHPVTGTGQPPKRNAPLGQSELAYLNRLPTDPASVPHDDAANVFRLQAATDGADPAQRGDALLLNSIAEPLRTYHDTNAAQAALAAAQRPLTDIPASALRALSDAIAREHPDLEPHEALGRASATLADIARQRLAKHAQRVQDAQGRLRQLTAAADQRAAVTRS